MASIRTFFSAIKGLAYKIKIDIFGCGKLTTIKCTSSCPNLVVSITSYGRRVNNVLYYTLISLFKQSKLPDKIILWLDDANWNNSNIPTRLKVFQQKGLEIAFCKDLRSYTKLVPTLNLYNNDIIITVDDDVIYPKHLVERLYQSYLNAPFNIHCGLAKEVTKHITGEFAPYNTWLEANQASENPFPLGYGGILYPPHTLYKDVFNVSLFQKLCPYADDIWFYIMAKLSNTKHTVVNIDRSSYTGVDIFQQYFKKGTALTQINVRNNGNDIQLKNVVDYYSLVI